jgi:uncharacterized protein (TIGR02996 family)
MRNPELEQVILDAPSDPAGYLVYADWLQANGDPRGELIVRQHKDDDLAKPWLDAHREVFLGRFATATPETFELEWRWGFVRKATIGWDLFGGEDEDDTSADQLEAFLQLESARFIEELWLGPTAHEDQLLLSELADAIDKVKPPNLKVLYLGDTSDWDISSTSTRMPVSASIPRMERLTLRGGNVALEDIDLPNLTEFSVETGGLTVAELRTISHAKWPNLESLEIWFGDPSYGASGTADDIAAIFDARGLGKLRTLKLMNCPFADAIAERLATSKILPQIRNLDLSMGNLSDRGVAAMLAAKGAFQHLDTLDISDNALTNASWPAARELAKTVTFGTEHDPDRAAGRFVSVGE